LGVEVFQRSEGEGMTMGLAFDGAVIVLLVWVLVVQFVHGGRIGKKADRVGLSEWCARCMAHDQSRITDHGILRQNVATYHAWCQDKINKLESECDSNRVAAINFHRTAVEAKATADGVAGTTNSFARTFNAVTVRQDEKLAEIGAEQGRTRLLLESLRCRLEYQNRIPVQAPKRPRKKAK
jgi:hypothetical protein